MKAIWITRDNKFDEQPFPGTFDQAVNFLKELAAKADFLFGQVLAEDGKVLENMGASSSINF